MNSKPGFARQVVSTLCAISIAAMQLLLPISNAYAQDVLDVDPPIIRHTIVSEGVAGIIQPFNAVVFDNAEITSVTLFHREKGETEFIAIEMAFKEKDDYQVFLPSVCLLYTSPSPRDRG